MLVRRARVIAEAIDELDREVSVGSSIVRQVFLRWVTASVVLCSGLSERGPRACTGLMKFVQIIEFTTSRIDEINEIMDEWLATTDGKRTAIHGLQTKDRDRDRTYLSIVEFPSYAQAMENSNLPETTAFAESMTKLCDGPPVFRDLDVLRDDTT